MGGCSGLLLGGPNSSAGIPIPEEEVLALELREVSQANWGMFLAKAGRWTKFVWFSPLLDLMS